MRLLAYGMLVCATLLASITPVDAASLADWRTDLAALLKDIKATHPDPSPRRAS